MYIRHETGINVASTSSGNISGYSTGSYTGFVVAIQMTTPTAAAGSAQLDITAERTGINILSLATSTSTGFLAFPRKNAVESTGGAALSTGSPCMLPLVDERVKFTWTSQATSTGCYTDFKLWVQ